MRKKMIDLSSCPICGNKPVTYTSSVSVVGCDFSAYIVECDADNDGTQELPFVEHNVCVYGQSQEIAKERWNLICAKK